MTRRVAHIDCSTGVSGDKLLGALLDLAGADAAADALDAAGLERLVAPLAPEARLVTRAVVSHGVAATNVRVEAAGDSPHRTWRDIRAMLESAGLPDATASRAVDVFAALAETEARVHGVDPDAVHFHEVGALDSIIDVVGVCACLDALRLDALTCSPVATGWGTVGTSHGVLAVPAPATALLLEGVSTVSGPARPDGSEPGELTTPTGAALVRTLCGSFGPPPSFTPAAVGHGAGTRDIGHPNVCRVTLGTADETAGMPGRPDGEEHGGHRTEPVAVLETNLDHLTPEAVAFTVERLLESGALDVWTHPIVMKKGRAAVTLALLCEPGEAARLTDELHGLTGTLGVRRHDLVRSVAPREQTGIATPWGPVRFKVGADRARPEHEDVARIARERRLAHDVVDRELRALFDEGHGRKRP